MPTTSPAPRKPAITQPERQLIRIEEAADLLQCTKNHIVNLIEEGKLDAINIGVGRRCFYRITAQSLTRFMQQRSSLKGVKS